MNSQEPALMFLYAADPQHDVSAVHLQLSDMVASGRLGDAIRAKGFGLSDIHLVAFEPVFGDHSPFDISGMLWHLQKLTKIYTQISCCTYITTCCNSKDSLGTALASGCMHVCTDMYVVTGMSLKSSSRFIMFDGHSINILWC